MNQKPGLLGAAERMRGALREDYVVMSPDQLERSIYCLAACDGIPIDLLSAGIVVKLSSYLRHLQAEVEFLRHVRELQAAKIRELREEIEGVTP